MTKKPPGLIDYDGDDGFEIERWTAATFETHWAKTLIKEKRLSAHPWSIKTKTLAKRLIQEFELEDLKNMITYWISKEPMEKAVSFELFYTYRHKIYDKIRPKDYREWES